MNVVKLLLVPSNLLNVVNVFIPLHITVLLNGMREFTWKRSPVKLFKMMNPLHIVVDCDYIKKHTPKRSPANVISVVKLLHFPVFFKCI